FLVATTGPPWVSTVSLHDALPILARLPYLNALPGLATAPWIPDRGCASLQSLATLPLRLGPFLSDMSMAGGTAEYVCMARPGDRDRKSTRLNSSHSQISYAVFCVK